MALQVVAVGIMLFNMYLLAENIDKRDGVNASINLIGIFFGILTLIVTF